MKKISQSQVEQIYGTVALLNLMVRSGEEHNADSESQVVRALENLNSLSIEPDEVCVIKYANFYHPDEGAATMIAFDTEAEAREPVESHPDMQKGLFATAVKIEVRYKKL